MSDRAARILSLLPIARHIAATYPPPFDDRVQDGMVGACQAVDDYDPGRGASLVAFARHRIRGAVKDGLRTEDHLTRARRRQVSERVDWIEEHPQEKAPARLGPPDPGPAHPIGVVLFIEEGFARVEATLAVAAGLGALNEKDRKAVTDYYLLGLSNVDMARTLGVHPVRMSQIRLRAERRMRDAMRAEVLR